jgi:predicted nuclease of restriction endonuclease-like (RecB) superfamily
MNTELKLYNNLLTDIKTRVRQGQLRATLSANAEMLSAYWDIGRMIQQRQELEGWGKGIIPRLAIDLKNEFSELKGFSERNIGYMLVFYKEYPSLSILQPPVAKLTDPSNPIVQPPVAQLESIKNQNNNLFLIGWTHHTILIQKVKDLPTRYWYMQQIIINGWSKETLIDMIKSKLHERQGSSVTNFDNTLPPLQSAFAKQILKDPYIFDFTSLAVSFSERELELELVKHIQKFLIELGAGFAFVGRQYKLEVSDRDFYIDLLFYHLKMRCFVVVELKKGEFLPEYAGKMNFYCSAIDDKLKHPTDQPTIGLILCQGKDKLFAEYSLKDINKPIGISDYDLTRALPENFKGSLPSIEEIEAEMTDKLQYESEK